MERVSIKTRAIAPGGIFRPIENIDFTDCLAVGIGDFAFAAGCRHLAAKVIVLVFFRDFVGVLISTVFDITESSGFCRRVLPLVADSGCAFW